MGKLKAAKIILLMTLGIILSIFIFSLFKNIQYPLLWNDETETAMYAKRILHYGYPKIHDGKNIVWLSEPPDKSIGINKRMDSCSALLWGQYYFAAIGEFFAEMTDDIYFKTALMRIPFALAGLAGLFIMALSISGLFGKDALSELTFLNIFFSFAILSIPLTLHLREVRHPALVTFLSACIIHTYFYYRYYGKIKFAQYFIMLALLLFLLYHVLHVVCFIFFAAIGLYECAALLKEKDIKSFRRNIAPLFAAFILVIPFFLFCQTFALGRAHRALYHINDMSLWNRHILGFFHIFQKYEFIYPVLAAKAIFFCIFAYFSNRRVSLGSAVRQKMRVSNFLSFLVIIYGFIVTFFPNQIIFERYYIVLHPIMIIILLLDLFGTFALLSHAPYASIRIWGKALCAAMLLLTLVINGQEIKARVKGHVYELLHQYIGPLDLAIPFIKSHYKNPESLVIATNYEELAYMYYLGSKTIVGFVGNNLDEDLKMRPDIIIFRKRATYVNPAVFNQFFLKDRYASFFFPLIDYPVNNIPETAYHLYKTLLCDDEKKCVSILIRSDHINAAS